MKSRIGWGGVSPNDYSITKGWSGKWLQYVLHGGRGSSQMITILHKGGLANDYGIT